MKFLFLCVLCGSCLPALCLDREAFTFTKYELTANVEPEQQRMGVRGKIILRNDSQSPQKNLTLQISSTLHWSSIQLDGKALDFTSQAYTSDIDHTGAMTEAIVSLPRAIAPRQAIELEIGYEGTIQQDATRLTRIGAPPDVANHSDWDQISPSFTGVRGIGYVAWYPIATEAGSLSEGNSVFEEVGRWKQRELGTEMRVTFSVRTEMKINLFQTLDDNEPSLICNGPTQLNLRQDRWEPGIKGDCLFLMTNARAPLFLVGNYQAIEGPAIKASSLPAHKSGADDYALAMDQIAPSIGKWFGDHRDTTATKAEVIDLPDPNAAPFESGNMLLMPLTVDETTMLLSALRQTTHLYFPSPRSWISDGLAGYAQANYFLNEKGPAAALAYLQSHRGALVQAEKKNLSLAGDHSAETSLINSPDDFYVQTKAMSVLWMLRDVVGEIAFTAALHNYNPHDDVRADYIQKLTEAQAHRDLGWFFDDWVYHDRGLPDFRIVSVYPRPLPTGGYMLTVLVENLGEAAAEVPVTARIGDKEVSERLMVPGKSKASVRIQATAMPQEVTVNDGSVPESDTSNNSYKVDPATH
jgi:hypothetical protein